MGMTLLEKGNLAIGTKALNMGMPLDPASPLLRIDPKKKNRYIYKDAYTYIYIYMDGY